MFQPLGRRTQKDERYGVVTAVMSGKKQMEARRIAAQQQHHQNERPSRQAKRRGCTSRSLSRGRKRGGATKKTKRPGDARAAARMGLAHQPVPD